MPIVIQGEKKTTSYWYTTPKQPYGIVEFDAFPHAQDILLTPGL